MWMYVLGGVLFIALGLAVHVGKWYFLIAGYNTMPKEKKAHVNTEGLGRLIGIYSYANGGILIVMGIFHALGLLNMILIPAIVFFLTSTVLVLVKAQKYDGNLFDEEGKIRTGAGKQFRLPGIITAVSVIFVAILLVFSMQPTKVTLYEGGLQIHGMYGDTYPWESIESAELKETLPTIELRTNGSALGPYLKGHFRTSELGSVKLFVNRRNPNFIYLETAKRFIIFNMNGRDETQKLFEEILRNMR